MAAGSLVKQFCDETACPICLEYFTDPVTTDCGHNFCRACLTQVRGKWVRNAFSCPECRTPVRHIRPNRKLASIVELSKKFSIQMAKGAEIAGKLCGRHKEPLKLFCWDDEAPICVVCERSKEHRGHCVNSVEEAAEDYKDVFQAELQSMENKRQKFVEWKASEEQRSQEYLEQLEAEKQEIMSVFEQMHKSLQEKEHCWLTELSDLEKEIKKRHDKNMTRLSQEISHFEKLIKDGEVKYRQPPSEFLQDIRNALTRIQVEQHKTPEELSRGLELRRDHLKCSVLKKSLQEFEGSLRRAQSKARVTLDPDTAHSRLILSEDLNSVRCEIPPQKLFEKPEKFDVMPFVLGLDTFTSGKHCWEVKKVKERGWWAVGVARESLSRKGWIRASPNVGIWAVGNDASKSHEVWALTSPKQTRVVLRGQLKKIRVFLDYEGVTVEFFNADTEDLIFSYPSASFSEEGLRPFFCVDGGASIQLM